MRQGRRSQKWDHTFPIGGRLRNGLATFGISVGAPPGRPPPDVWDWVGRPRDRSMPDAEIVRRQPFRQKSGPARYPG